MGVCSRRTPVMGSRRSGNRRKWVQEERGRGENTPRAGTEERETEEKKMRGEQREQREREREREREEKNEKRWYFGSCEKKININEIIKHIKK